MGLPVGDSLDILGPLQDEFGLAPDSFSSTRVIAESRELARVRDLRRRRWQDDPTLPQAARELTAYLRYDWTVCKPRCLGCEAESLRPAQAAFMIELMSLGAGALFPLRVGGGKTLPSLVAPTLVGARRPLLVIPAALRAKTERAARQYARHWKVANVTIVTYEFLGGPKRLNWLEEFAPDFVFCDEAHKLKRSSSKVTKRLSRYKRAHPEVRMAFATGSAAGRSIREYWHYLRWALGDRAPIPGDPLEAGTWAYALDEKVPPEARFEPGALLTLAPPPPGSEDLDALTRARMAYRDRFACTPGIISSGEDIPSVGLEITTEEVALPPALAGAITRMRDTWCTPGGEEFALAFDLWRHARTLGCGLYYKWDPPAPAEWLARRREWFVFVREALKHSRTKDSIVHIVEGVKDGSLRDGGVYAAWKEIEPTYRPRSVPVWVDKFMVERCAEWLLTRDPRGVCWVEHAAFGRELAARTGLPFFHAGGMDSIGRLAEAYRGGSAILSVKACREGQNLQWYAQNLFPSPPSKGDWWEQMLGRTHRDGQEADTVTGTVFLTCKESYQSLAQAIRDARFVQDSHGVPQKLCYANQDLGPVMDLAQDENRTDWHEHGV